MDSSFLLLLLLALSLTVAPLVHLIIAYVVAPKKAKQAILDALIGDDHFQELLIGSIVKNLLRPIKVKDENGVETMMPAIDPVLKRAISGLEYWLKGKQGKMQQEMGEQSSEIQNQIAQGGNPVLAMAMAQIPKKYRWLISLVMSQFQQQ